MGFKEHIRVARRPSPDTLPSPPTMPHDAKLGTDKRGRTVHKYEDAIVGPASVDPELAGKLPKRSSSFGRGLGGLQSIASGMSRASESLTRKNAGSDGNRTPPTSHTTPGLMGPPAMPGSSHLAQFSLKLSELVNKAFIPCTGVTVGNANGGTTLAGAAKNAAAKTTGSSLPAVPALSAISYEGKKLPSKPVISEIAVIVVAELEYASSVDPYLLRAVSRQALKALTLFSDRVDSLVISPSKDLTASSAPSTAKEGVHPPAALEFNLGLATLEWIVEDALERCIEGPPGSEDEGMPHFVSEILTPVRKKMEATILHVIQPLLSKIKASFTVTLSKAVLSPFSGYGQSLTPMSSAGNNLASGIASPGPLSPPIPPSSAFWLKELEGKVEGTRRLLVPRLVERCGQDGEGWYISAVIHAIWKGLLILSSRSMPVPTALATKYPSGLPGNSLQMFAAEAYKRTPSPAQLTTALKSVSVVGRTRKGTDGMTSPSGTATPSTINTPAAVPTSVVQVGSKATASQAYDLQAFEKLMYKFAAGFTAQKSKTISAEDEDSSDSDDDDEDELARAALSEALQAIHSTLLVVQHLDLQPEAVLEAAKSVRGRTSQSSSAISALPADVGRAAKAIPPLILLHLVYARMPANIGVFALQSGPASSSSDPIVPSPPAVFRYSWTDYERAIGGFVAGQTWAVALAEAWRQDVEEAWTDVKTRQQAIEEQARTKESRSTSSESDDSSRLSKQRSSESAQSVTVQPIAEAGTHVAELPAPADSTPTPESVLLHRRASPATSAGTSSDSLPEHMTQSAPDLMRDDKTKHLPSQPGPAVVAPKEKPTWAFMRRPSRMARSASGSEASSPRRSPEASPPHTPALPATTFTHDPTRPTASATGNSTPSRRFWRTASSQGNVPPAVAGGDARGFHLPSLASVRTAVSRDGAAANASVVQPRPREEDRVMDELRLEMESLRLLGRALEVVDASNTTSMEPPV